MYFAFWELSSLGRAQSDVAFDLGTTLNSQPKLQP